MNIPSMILGAVLAYTALLIVCQIASIIKHGKELKHKKYAKSFMKKVENFNFEEEE